LPGWDPQKTHALFTALDSLDEEDAYHEQERASDTRQARGLNRNTEPAEVICHDGGYYLPG